MAEKKCRRLNAGKLPSSPELTKAQKLIEIWQLVPRRLRGYKENTITILNKKKAVGFQGITDVNLRETLNNLNDSYKKYKIIVKTCGKRRVTILNELAAANERAGKAKV